ncbi:MAG: hypothetical protein K5681_09455, partial [Treponema sp.]|nr:hypothetical protein [Treponema sp.]
MEKLSKKPFDALGLVKTCLSWTSKISVLLLFLFMFIGRMNPARISGLMNGSTSLVKSAFYFRGYVQPLLDAEKNGSNDKAADLEENTESDSYDDFYSNFAAMVESAAANDSSEMTFDDSEEDTKAKKIKANKFSAEWDSFKGRHAQIASALEAAHRNSILTFFAIIICVVGMYFAFGKNKFRKLGNAIIILGAILTIVTLTFHAGPAAQLASVLDGLDVKPIPAAGIGAFITFSIIAIVLSLALIFIEKAPEGEKSELVAQPFQITYRLLALLLFILLFIPGANPARISLNISRNVSLFTSGFSYGTYTQNMERLFIRGWLPESVMVGAFFCSLLTCLGIIACGVGSCMSVGNNKLKRIAHFTILGGSALSFFSMFGIVHAYNLLTSSENVGKIEPLEPQTVPLL